MEIDVKSSIEGLWVAPLPYGYLGSWFKILDQQLGQFIPIAPGLNVFYGRNGAGKTQLLRAIESASRFKMSSYEGFMLRNPGIKDSSGAKYIFDTSPKEILDFYRRTGANETNFTDELGLRMSFEVTDHQQAVRNDVLMEFLKAKRCLLTRSMAHKWDHDGGPGPMENMNDPESMHLVPALLPLDEAPITRAHAREIASSYNFLAEEITATMDALETDNERTDYWSDASKKLESWLKSWIWSPLVNQRNFGFVNCGAWQWAPETHAFNLTNCSSTAIFLPSIWQHSPASPEYQEFDTPPTSHPDFHFSVMRESARKDLEESPRFILRDTDLGNIPWSPFQANDEDLDLERQSFLVKFQSDLQSRLTFLPGLRNLRVESEAADPGVRGSQPRHLLYLSNGVRADAGSEAEKRWLSLACEAQKMQTEWVIVDEPEAGLHRTAEAELANSLASPSWNNGNVIVVATHSPEFLNLENAQVTHIDSGTARAFTGKDREDLSLLGLRPADLLTQIRSFLLVEGEHEKLIFDALFSEELQRMRCKIIVARGGKNMRDVFESQMIFEFSDAVVVSLLDNIDGTTVAKIWSEARSMAARGELIPAGQYVRSRLPGAKSGENVFLSQFLTMALANGQHERVEVWGLSKPDIVMYLEPGSFGLKKGWEALLAERKSSDPSLKEWARLKYGADFSVEAVSRAAKSLDFVPDELGNLLMRVSEISRRSGA